MRAILIILALTAFGFVWWLLTKWNINFPSPTNNPDTGISTISSSDAWQLDQLRHQVKMEEEIKQLKEEVRKLSSNSIQITTQKNSVSSSQNEEVIPVSAKFLGKILPVVELTKTENNGIFDLRIFDTTSYTTYKDEKFGMTVVASMLTYEQFLKNFQAVDKSIYTVNETQTFPFESFFVNPEQTDSTVRIVMKVEAQTLLISLPKSKFNTFKELILKTK